MTSSFPSIWLAGGRVALTSRKAIPASLEIEAGRIRRLTESAPGRNAASSSRVRIDLEGHLILPGLINAHDHLEFNLFSRLGRGPYANSGEWARDIYLPETAPVCEQLSISKSVRLWWGGLKNLLSGVTTVCHHNDYDRQVFDGEFPVRVVQRYGWAHSMIFDRHVLQAFRATDQDHPFIIHLGEGTDTGSSEEIFELDRLGALDRRTILVHGVALTDEGHRLRRKRGAALVWCPTSNRFLLGKTLDASSIASREAIALGTDSALTARGDLLDEIRAAHEDEGLDADAIYSMVTRSAAAILRLNDGEGRLDAGSAADLIALRATDRTPAEALVHAGIGDIEMVVVSGKPQLLSAEMAMRWPRKMVEGLEWLTINGTRRLVRAPVSRLLGEAAMVLTGRLRLAGKEISA